MKPCPGWNSVIIVSPGIGDAIAGAGDKGEDREIGIINAASSTASMSLNTTGFNVHMVYLYFAFLSNSLLENDSLLSEIFAIIPYMNGNKDIFYRDI